MASPGSFDPFTQNFTLRLDDGTPFIVSIPDVDEFYLYSIQICINYAAQLGASSILLIALLVLTKPDKRLTPVFILNSLALGLNIIRNVLQCLYFTSPFLKMYAHFGQDYSRVPRSAYATSVAATVLAVLLLICIEVSLVLQVRVVCFLLVPVYRRAIFAFSAITALLAVGFRLALCVENSKFIISLEPPSSLNWLESAANITTSISICWFCAVFVTKLGFALHERRQLGLKRFGPMQIIFIMGCQTLIVPGVSDISTRVRTYFMLTECLLFLQQFSPYSNTSPTSLPCPPTLLPWWSYSSRCLPFGLQLPPVSAALLAPRRPPSATANSLDAFSWDLVALSSTKRSSIALQA